MEMSSSITQILVFDLDKGNTNEELSEDRIHAWLLDTCRCMEGAGCRGIIWSVTEEDPTVLIWLIEWATSAKDTDFMLRMRKVALDLLRHTRLSKEPDMKLRSDHTYLLDPPPSALLSAVYPILEVFQYYLNEDVSFEQHQDVMKPVTEHWKQEGRHYAVASAFTTLESKDEKKEEGRNCVFVVLWRSVEEHMNAINEDYFREAIKKGDKMQTPKLFAHIRPLAHDE